VKAKKHLLIHALLTFHGHYHSSSQTEIEVSLWHMCLRPWI